VADRRGDLSAESPRHYGLLYHAHIHCSALGQVEGGMP